MHIKIHKHDNEKTIWQNFESNIGNKNNVREIVAALSVVNSTLIGLSNDNLEDKMLEIVEFGDKFNAIYGKKTKKARFENWGQEAFSLRLYTDIKENCQYEIEALKKLENTDKNHLNKLRKLERSICSIRGNKNVTVCLSDGHCSFNIESDKRDLSHSKVLRALMNDALSESSGVIINRKNFNNTSNIYGFRTDKYEVEPISIQELRMSYSIDANTGKKIKIPAELRFKEFRIE